MNREIIRLATEFVSELEKSSPDDYLQIKLMMLSVVRYKSVDVFLHKIFELAEERRPLLLEIL